MTTEAMHLDNAWGTDQSVAPTERVQAVSPDQRKSFLGRLASHFTTQATVPEHTSLATVVRDHTEAVVGFKPLLPYEDGPQPSL